MTTIGGTLKPRAENRVIILEYYSTAEFGLIGTHFCTIPLDSNLGSIPWTHMVPSSMVAPISGKQNEVSHVFCYILKRFFD